MVDLWRPATFEDHMRPDVVWIEDPAYGAAFDDLMEQDMAAFTDTSGVSYPGYINARFEHDKIILTMRGAPIEVAATEDTEAHVEEAPTVVLPMSQHDWDQFVAEATRERGLTGV